MKQNNKRETVKHKRLQSKVNKAMTKTPTTKAPTTGAQMTRAPKRTSQEYRIYGTNFDSASDSEQTSSRAYVAEHYIKSINFDSTIRREDLPANAPLRVKTSVGVFATEEGADEYEVVIQIHCDAKHKSKNVFDLKLEYAGLCVVEGITDERKKDEFLRATCADQIFPFAKIMVANITKDAGYPPMLFDMDFARIYQEQVSAA